MHDLLAQLTRGTPLSSAQAEAAFAAIMSGTADPLHTASLLSLLAAREPTADELHGAALVMRRHVLTIAAPKNVIDTCGTGGTGSRHFNISTTVAIVTAAAGVPVAKHGNRSVTSRSGSSDVLRALGVNIETSPAQAARCLKDAGICFAFAPRHHPAMKHVAPIRQALGFSTIFNLLGPLTNPAGARRQVVGTRSAALADKLLDVLVRLGAQRAIVVSGTDPRHGPLCDISVTGPTHIADYDGVFEDGFGDSEGGGVTRRFSITPEDLGLKTHPHAQDMLISSPEESARLIRSLLAREIQGAARDIVLINTAAALWAGGAAPTLKAGVDKAVQTIETGAAQRTLERLITLSQEPA